MIYGGEWSGNARRYRRRRDANISLSYHRSVKRNGRTDLSRHVQGVVYWTQRDVPAWSLRRRRRSTTHGAARAGRPRRYGEQSRGFPPAFPGVPDSTKYNDRVRASEYREARNRRAARARARDVFERRDKSQGGARASSDDANRRAIPIFRAPFERERCHRDGKRENDENSRILTSVSGIPLDAILTTSRWRFGLDRLYLPLLPRSGYLLRASLRVVFHTVVLPLRDSFHTPSTRITNSLPFSFVAHARTDRAQLTLHFRVQPKRAAREPRRERCCPAERDRVTLWRDGEGREGGQAGGATERECVRERGGTYAR